MVPSPPFRQGTKISIETTALIYNAGGIGDYINWTTAIRYALDSNPHIKGYIVTPPYFEDLCRLWLSSYAPRFEIKVTPQFEDENYLDEIPCIVPNKSQYANAGGFHLFSLGFAFYNQINYVPKGYETIPEIRGDEADVTQFQLPPKYAVIATNATADNRRLPAQCLNEISSFLIERGITPVYLGKVSLHHEYEAKASEGLNLEGVIDLREKTSLVEAACVMSKAKFTFGLDGGLLHLASTTKAPVVWIFTSADPLLRLPPRRKNTQTVTITPPEKLECRFCQTRMRYVFGHDFKNCLYGDHLCVTSLKASDIINVLKQTVLKERNEKAQSRYIR